MGTGRSSNSRYGDFEKFYAGKLLMSVNCCFHSDTVASEQLNELFEATLEDDDEDRGLSELEPVALMQQHGILTYGYHFTSPAAQTYYYIKVMPRSS